MEKKNVTVVDGELVLSEEFKKMISDKKEEIRKSCNIKKVYSIVVLGSEDDGKEAYVAYLRQPNMAEFAAYMSMAGNDSNYVGAALNLAKAVFVGGDRELVDDTDLFTMGLMQSVSEILKPRVSALVKV